MEKSGPGDVFDVGCKGEGVVEDDAEAFDLGGEWDREIVNDDVWDGVGGVGECMFGADEQGLGFTAI